MPRMCHEQIGHLIHLRELLVDGNEILSLPLELGNLQKIEILNVNNNPGDLLPEGFTDKGMKAVRLVAPTQLASDMALFGAVLFGLTESLWFR